MCHIYIKLKGYRKAYTRRRVLYLETQGVQRYVIPYWVNDDFEDNYDDSWVDLYPPSWFG